MSRHPIAWAILAWTAVSWGGRIRLLTDADTADLASWLRIGGSLVVGVATWAAIVRGRGVRPAVWLFAAWTLAVWGRSLVVVWTETNTTPFRLVHTVLATVWFGLVAAALDRYRAADQAGSGTRSTAGA